MDWSKLKTDERTDHAFYGAYRDRAIEIEREHAEDSWYITVIAPCGMLDYDGWWSDSTERSLDEAIEEAVRGAMIDEYAEELAE